MASGDANGDGLLHCYNKGCLQKFEPASNSEGACRYHPGPPYFHDAYKIWNCCGKKSIDFGTWMSYPGCTTGKHCATKPEAGEAKPPPPAAAPKEQERMVVWNGLNKPAERPADPAQRRPMARLPVEIGESALKAIHQQRELMAAAAASDGGCCDASEQDELAGAVCQQCKAVYSALPESAAAGECLHHPGTAVFHEGLKYWSCCEKKTSNFSAFLDQQGCATGKHQWAKNEKVDALKEDWFSRAGSVHLNVYCKGALPDVSLFECDGLLLRAQLVHGHGTKESALEVELWGEIVPQESRVIVGERKVEIVMKQASLEGWPKLRYEPSVDK